MLKLTLVTPTKKITMDSEVEDVFVPGYRGELNILEGHAPLVTTLSTGILKYRNTNTKQDIIAAISWGYCEVVSNQINILAETAELPEEIDVARAETSIQSAHQALESATLSPEEIKKYQNKLLRAQNRLEVAKYRSGAPTVS